MDNKQSNFQRWFMERYNVTNQQRPSGAAPPVGSRDFYDKPNPYWLDQGARRKAQASSNKPQAASNKLDKD